MFTCNRLKWNFKIDIYEEKWKSPFHHKNGHSTQSAVDSEQKEVEVMKYLPAKNNYMLKNRLLFSRKIS